MLFLWSSLPAQRKHATSPSRTSCIYLHPSDLPASPLLLKREKALHFLLLSPPSPSIHLHIIPRLLSSSPHLALPFQIRLAASLCRRKLQTAGNRHADGQRRRSPRGFLTLRFSQTLSHQISISFSLMCSLHPSSSLFSSLSVPLSLSCCESFVFARLSAHSRSGSLSHSVLRFASLPHSSSLFYPTNPSAYLPCLCFPHSSCFYCIHHLVFFLSSDRSHEECNKVHQFLKDQEIVCVSVHVLTDV